MTAASNEVVAVIQADRDIAHEIMQIVRGYRVNLPHDRHWLIDIVARHRIAHSDPRPVAEGLREGEAYWQGYDAGQRAATHSPAPMAGEGWQDIASAPKDGSAVDLWVIHPVSGGKRRTDAVWDDEAEDWRIGQYFTHMYTYPPRVTHWMRPPAPPIAAHPSTQEG